jgi:hypothetical protein
MPTAKQGNIEANYRSDEVDDAVIQDILETVFGVSCFYPKDLFYNLAYPNLRFDVSRRSDGRGYQMTLKGYGWVADPYLKFTKEVYESLNKRYPVSIVFLDSKGKKTLEYSKAGYWRTLLLNHCISFLILPFVTIGMLYLGNYLATLLSNGNDTGFFVKFARELLPTLIGFPISLVAFKLQPMILPTKVMSSIIILASTFLFYFFTGNGLVGSLILLALFVLQSIQSSL